MGYVFDALNRSHGEDRPHAPAKTPGDALPPQVAPPHIAPPPSVPPVTDEAASFSLADLPPPPFAPSPQQAQLEAELAQPRLRIATGEPVATGVDDRMVMITEPSSIMAEEYRSIRTGLLARCQQKRHMVHTITSATPQEGKTITSLNLGLSFAELRNRRTIVIEADLRLPQFGKLLGIPEGTGMVNYLTGEKKLSEVIHTVGDTGLSVIPAGGRVSNEAVQLLSSNTMSSLLKTLRQSFDHVIVDTPPVVELADAGILGAQSDDVLLIVRMQRTPRQLVEQAIRTLESYNAPVAGLIATDQKRHRGRYYYRYGYSYGYRYHKRAA